MLIQSVAVSALLTLPSHPELLFNLVTLPLLIQLAAATTTVRFLKHSLPILAAASTLRSLPTIHGLLPSTTQAILIQALFSLVLATFISLPVVTFTIIRRSSRLALFGGWREATSFGLVWAGAWWVWEGLSPLGRYGIPSPLVECPPAALLVRVAGPTGVDIVLGTVSYALVQVGRSAAAYSGAVLPTVTARAPTPLIVLEDEVEQAEPPVTKAVVTRGISSSITRASKVAAVSVLAFSTLAWIPAPLSLSSPMSEITPLSIGCVLGPTHAHDVDTLVRESKRLGGHDRIVVWPESALQVEGKAQRTQVLETVTAQLGRQYGTLVAVGMESRSQESRLNEMVLVGRDGVMGEYSKQRLFPIVESYALDRHRQSPPVWSLPLPRPSTIPNRDWAARNITVSPLICLDTFHPSLLHSQTASATPSLLIVPAAFPSLDIGINALTQIRTLAISHATPAFVCSVPARNPQAAFAAYIDEWGRVMHFQAGGTAMSTVIPVRYYGEGRGRSRTTWEYLGSSGVGGIVAAILVSGHVVQTGTRLLRGREVPPALVTVGERVRGLVGWHDTEVARTPIDAETLI